jgi:prepilin-type N-terminal cleavage/methylation domain-containing protein
MALFFPAANLYQRAVKTKFQVSGFNFQVPRRNLEARVSPASGLPPSAFRLRRAFTLVEVMVVMVLLSLIVFALMAVFNGAQNAFRASVTQTDVLEGGRAAMDLITEDLREMSPSRGRSTNSLLSGYYSAVPVNFYANTNLYQYQSQSSPLVQSLVASSVPRTNVLENFFILSRQNTTWSGVGYAVDTASASAINPLYRFYMTTNVEASPDPTALFNGFMQAVLFRGFTNSPNWSHLLDGVVDLTVRAYDPNGCWMTNGVDYDAGQWTTNQNTLFPPPALGEAGFYMFSNTLPASVQIEMGVLEDRTLQRAGAFNGNPSALNAFLAQQAGQVHLFRQRVWIPNVDPSAYP